MKSWFEKWQAEKAKRKEKGLPSVVDYRDVTYVSDVLLVGRLHSDKVSGSDSIVLHRLVHICSIVLSQPQALPT